MKLDLLTNVSIVDDAIRFITSLKQQDKEKAKASPYEVNNIVKSKDLKKRVTLLTTDRYQLG
jgi:phosphopantothenate synthetase